MAESETVSTSVETKKLAPTIDPVTYEDYEKSAYYNSAQIDQLNNQLTGYQMTDDQLRSRAEAEYNPTYQTELEALRQQLAQQTQGYQNQISGMNTAYDKQRRAVNQSYDESVVNLNNALTARGLGRSSLVGTQGAYLEGKRNQALDDITSEQTAQINGLNEKIALLTDQTAQSERTLTANYAQQIEQRINALRSENQTASTQLQLQIASLQQQGYLAYQNWLLQQQQLEMQNEQFEKNLALQREQFEFQKEQANKKSSGSGGSKSSYVPTPTPEPTPEPPPSEDLNDEINKIFSKSGTPRPPVVASTSFGATKAGNVKSEANKNLQGNLHYVI